MNGILDHHGMRPEVEDYENTFGIGDTETNEGPANSRIICDLSALQMRS